MNDDYMSEADNEVDGGYFADLEYEYQQKEIRRQEDKENKAKKEENRKQQLLRQNKCIENLKAKLERKNQQIDQLKQQLEESFTEEDVEGLIEDRNKTIKFLQKELAEKDKEVEELKLKLDIRAISLQNINTERIESERSQTQLAIQELEKVKTLIQNAINFETNFVGVYDAINNQIKELKGENK